MQYAAARRGRRYNPRAVYEQSPALQEVVEAVAQGQFDPPQGPVGCFRPLVEGLLDQDEYFLVEDFKDYCRAQERVMHTFHDEPHRWSRMALINIANSGTVQRRYRLLAEPCQPFMCAPGCCRLVLQRSNDPGVQRPDLACRCWLGPRTIDVTMM